MNLLPTSHRIATTSWVMAINARPIRIVAGGGGSDFANVRRTASRGATGSYALAQSGHRLACIRARSTSSRGCGVADEDRRGILAAFRRAHAGPPSRSVKVLSVLARAGAIASAPFPGIGGAFPGIGAAQLLIVRIRQGWSVPAPAVVYPSERILIVLALVRAGCERGGCRYGSGNRRDVTLDSADRGGRLQRR